MDPEEFLNVAGRLSVQLGVRSQLPYIIEVLQTLYAGGQLLGTSKGFCLLCNLQLDLPELIGCLGGAAFLKTAKKNAVTWQSMPRLLRVIASQGLFSAEYDPVLEALWTDLAALKNGRMHIILHSVTTDLLKLLVYCERFVAIGPRIILGNGLVETPLVEEAYWAQAQTLHEYWRCFVGGNVRLLTKLQAPCSMNHARVLACVLEEMPGGQAEFTDSVNQKALRAIKARDLRERVWELLEAKFCVVNVRQVAKQIHGHPETTQDIDEGVI